MSTLEKLLKLDGVKAAGEFKKDGSLKAFKGSINKAAAEDLARYCTAMNGMLETIGLMSSKLDKLDIDPYHGFVHCGGNSTIFAGQDHFAIVDETADWNEVSYAVLKGEFPE